MSELINEYPNAVWIVGILIVIEIIAIVYIVKRRKTKQQKQSATSKEAEPPSALSTHSETIAPLERSDVMRLLKDIRTGFLLILIITIGVWAVLYFVADVGVVGYSIYAFFMCFLWIGLVRGRQDFRRLINEDKKIILIGAISERYEKEEGSGDSSWTYYYLRIGEQTLKVDKEIYKRYALGQVVEFHFVRNGADLPILLKDKLIS